VPTLGGFSESAWGVFANSFAAASDGVVDWGSNRKRVAEADVFLCLDDGSDGEKARRRVPHEIWRDDKNSTWLQPYVTLPLNLIKSTSIKRLLRPRTILRQLRISLLLTKFYQLTCVITTKNIQYSSFQLQKVREMTTKTRQELTKYVKILSGCTYDIRPAPVVQCVTIS